MVEKQGKWNEIKATLRNPITGHNVGVQVFINEGRAMAVFSDVQLGRLMVAQERRGGNKNIRSEKAKLPDGRAIEAVIELFPGKSKEEITKEIAHKLKASKGKVKEK